MRLSKISLKNYRSIDESVELSFKKTEKPCYFIFGINETGKSNILKGCNLLAEEARSKFNWAKDCFKDNKRNGDITEVDYYFDLEEQEVKEVKDILNQSIPQEILSQIAGVWYWIEGDTDSETYTGFRFTLNDPEKLKGYFKKKKKTEPQKTEEVPATDTQPKENEQANESLFVLVKESDIDQSQKADFEEVEVTKIGEVLAGLVDDGIIEAKLPRIVFWDSSSRYLINGTVDLNKFKEDPATNSVPLFNMFKLVGLNKETIKDEITESLKEATDRHKLAEDLSKATTEHLNKVWREHEVEVHVTIDASGACDVHFTDNDADTNFFEMQDRSDGFQRFISFILTLSAENLNEDLKNTIVLLDEPEVHLHPSGIEYLKDELLNIAANNNYILAASHSIFLVDKKCLERHITVKKIAGKTLVSYVNPDNPFQEEVIFRALNTSLYELIQPLSIVFEGTIDSDVFLAVKHKLRSELTGLISVGGIGATGAPEVKKYEKFFKGNLMAQAVALFDSDDEGRRELKIIRDDALFDNNAFELKDIYDLGKSAFELEDLLPTEIVTETAKNLYKHDFLGMDNNKPILDEIKRIKHEQNITDDKKLEILKSGIVKTVLRDTDPKVLSKEKFKEKYEHYYKFLKALQTKIAGVKRSA